MFVPRRGWYSGYIYIYWMSSESIHALMELGNTQAVTLPEVKWEVIWATTEMTHLTLNQLPVFPVLSPILRPTLFLVCVDSSSQ